jgi:hypothetical protein
MSNAVFDNLVGGNQVELLVLKHDAAIGRAQEARDGLERGGLAGAVGANQRHYFTLIDLEGDVPEYLQIAVENINIFNPKHRTPLPGRL